MSELSNKIREIRGEQSAEAAARAIGVSRESFYRIERGGSIKLSTLRQLATGLGLSEEKWLDLLIAWLRHKAGPDKDKLYIDSRAPLVLDHGTEEAQTARLLRLFNELNAEERRQILLVLERPEVRRSLSALNKLYDAVLKQ